MKGREAKGEEERKRKKEEMQSGAGPVTASPSSQLQFAYRSTLTVLHSIERGRVEYEPFPSRCFMGEQR